MKFTTGLGVPANDFERATTVDTYASRLNPRASSIIIKKRLRRTRNQVFFSTAWPWYAASLNSYSVDSPRFLTGEIVIKTIKTHIPWDRYWGFVKGFWHGDKRWKWRHLLHFQPGNYDVNTRHFLKIGKLKIDRTNDEFSLSWLFS